MKNNVENTAAQPASAKQPSFLTRVIAIVVAVVVVIGVVTGIAFWAASHDPNAPTPGLMLNDKLVRDPGWIMKVGDTEVPFDVYRHYFLYYKSYFIDLYGKDYFRSDPDGEKMLVLQNSVEAELENVYAWLAIAEEIGTEISEEQRADIAAVAEEQKLLHGDQYDTYLTEEMFFTCEENYMQVTEMQLLVELAREDYRNLMRDELADTVVPEAEANFLESHISAKHILVAFPKDENASASSEETVDAAVDAEAKARAQEFYDEIMASANPEATFDEIMLAYSEDSGVKNAPDGYTFKEGDMVEEFYNGAIALEEGGISEPVRSAHGYHIIMRIPVIQADIDTYCQEQLTSQANIKLGEKSSAVSAALPVSFSDYYSRMRVNDIC